MTTRALSILLFLAIGMSSTGIAFADIKICAISSDYDQGYKVGCSDSKITNSNDREVQQSEGYSKQFMNGYSRGFEICSGLNPANFNCGVNGTNPEGCKDEPYCDLVEGTPITCYDQADVED